MIDAREIACAAAAEAAAIWVRRRNQDGAGDHRPVVAPHPAERARDGEARQRPAVVAALERDDLEATSGSLREAESDLVGLGAGAPEETHVEPAEGGESLCQLDPERAREPVPDLHQLPCLRGDRGRDARVPVSRRHAELSRLEVEIAPPFDIPDRAA